MSNPGHTPLSLEELIEALRPGRLWRNVHTAAETTIVDFGSEPETGIGWRGSVRVPAQCLVHHTSNVPPGFKRGSGQPLASFVEHWRPA